jgi:GTPase SAR1 family protein
MPEYSITMLGARGVGKTSLLSALYHQFELVDKTNLQLIADVKDATSARLTETLGRLKTLPLQFTIRPGTGTEEALKYLFSLYDLKDPRDRIKEKNKKLLCKLRFHDYPGGYLSSNATDEQREYVSNLVKNSQAVLVTIDAPAMMEKDEDDNNWHDFVNRPQQIKDIFNDAYANDEPRLVILAPVKCEKYMKTQHDIEILLGTLKQKYQNLIEFFRSKPNVTVVITPIQTVGTVVFFKLLLNQQFNTPEFHFEVERKAYEPKNAEQPFYWLLLFFLKLGMLKHPMPTFAKWLGFTKGIDLASKQLNEELKDNFTQGFQVIQWGKLSS